MKTLFVLFLLFISTISLFANPEPREQLAELSLDQLINKATRQRMLSQRIAKCYFAIGMNLETKFYQLQMTDAASTYKKQLAELKTAAPTPEMLAKLKAVETIFQDYEKLVFAPIERANALQVLQTSEVLLGHCNEVIMSLCAMAENLPQNLNEKISNKEYAKLLADVGMNRMLTQRVSLLYLANLWEIDTEHNKTKIDQVLFLFSQNLQEMQKLTQNTEQINEYIFEVLGEWRFVAKACLYLDEQNRAEAVRFLEKSDFSANTIHKLASLYEKLFDLDSGSLSNQGKN